MITDAKWKLQFKSLDGTTYTVLIKGGLYVGDPTNLLGAANPLTTEEDDEEDLFLPVRTQSGYMRIIDQAGTWESIMPTSATDRPVYVYAGSNLVWKGYLQPETFSGDYMVLPQERDFPLCCPLSVLASFDVEPDSSKATVSFAGVLYYIFSKLGTAEATSDDGFYFFFQGHLVIDGWLAKRVSWANFENGDLDEDPTAKYNCLELLEHVCKFFGYTCRIQGKNIYFVMPDYEIGNFAQLTLANLQTIESGGSLLHMSIPWMTVTLENVVLGGNLFKSNRDSETIMRGIRKATVKADINKIEKLLDMPFGLIEKTLTGNTVYAHKYHDANATSPDYSLLWKNAPDYSNQAFGGIYLSTNSENLRTGSSQTGDTYCGAFIDVYEFYEGGIRNKHNWSFATDLYIVGTKSVPSSDPWEAGQPGGIILDTLPLVTIKTKRKFTLSTGILVMSGSVHSDYIVQPENQAHHHEQHFYEGKLIMRVSVGDYYYNTQGYWSPSPSNLNDYLLEVPVNDDGAFATNRRLWWPYPAYDGYGMMLGAGSGNSTYSISGQLKIEIFGWQANGDKHQKPGTVIRISPNRSALDLDTSDNIHIQSLKVEFLRHNDWNAHDDRSSNEYTASVNAVFDDKRTVSTIFASDNGNAAGYGLIMNPNGQYCQMIPIKGSYSDHPEQHVANMIASYGGALRRVYKMMLKNSALIIKPSTQVVEYHGVNCYPVAISHEWRDDEIDLTLMQLSNDASAHVPATPRFYILADIDEHVSLSDEIPDRVVVADYIETQLIPDEGWEVTTVTVTMGGEAVSNAYDAETGMLLVIDILGDVVINVEAAEVQPSTSHTVTATLTNVTSDAPASVDDGDSLTVNLTADTGHYIDDSSVVVMMGNTDITSTAYSNGVVTIASVTDDVEITAVATVQVITFQDSTVKSICVSNWGGNVVAAEITPAEAAAVTTIGTKFKGTAITSLNELKYFTGLATAFDNYAFQYCSQLTEITLPVNLPGLGQACFMGCTRLQTIVCLNPNRTRANFSQTFGNATNNYTGRNYYSAGTNRLYVPKGKLSTYNEQWDSTLCDSTKCGFTKVELNEDGTIPT